ncbi:MAG: hypothetical protein KKA90_03440 [Nanoarchaeota archaeon]|nr:hypothetical protein [Nanoarchaeota archaeon]
MTTVLCFGNPHLQDDSLVASLMSSLALPGIEFISCTTPDDLLLHKDFIILDVAKGITEPVFLANPDQLRTRNLVSLHDFDLNFFLKLYAKLGNHFKVLAIPYDYDKEKAVTAITELLTPR